MPHSRFVQTSPVGGHLALSPGLVSSEKVSADHILSRKGGGNLLAIIVGGAQEALDARPGAYRLLLACDLASPSGNDDHHRSDLTGPGEV